MRVIQRVKGVEKLFLGRFFAGDEVDIIYNQYIYVPVFLPESRGSVMLYGVNQLVGKFFRRHITNFYCRRAFAFYGVADGVHKMSFPQPYAAIDEQGVIGFCRRFCYC